MLCIMVMVGATFVFFCGTFGGVRSWHALAGIDGTADSRQQSHLSCP